MYILGIDPGLATTGWGVVGYDKQGFWPVSFGIIKTSSKERLQDRIFTLAEDVASVATKYKIDACSMEDIYFARNITSAVPVAKVIGALTYKLMQMEIPVSFYSPLQIKMAVTGTGTADKHQIQEMVRLHLKLDKIPRPDHAADALADCICYIQYNSGDDRLRRS